MSVFDIDEIIDDPWMGLRNTDAYLNYVLEEVQRLLDGGKLEINTRDFIDEIYDPRPPHNFIFDGRKFVYDYWGSRIGVGCEEWGGLDLKNYKEFHIRNGEIVKK